jgi:hypothetical protein
MNRWDEANGGTKSSTIQINICVKAMIDIDELSSCCAKQRMK